MNTDKITLSIHPAREQAGLAAPAAHWWQRVDGTPWMQRYDLGGGSLLRLSGLADFRIDARGTAVEAWPVPGLDEKACRQLYLNNVLPMALSRQGKLVLHASAVEVFGSAVVFVGVSGRGKSTLATSFARDGHALIMDDGLVVEVRDGRFMAIPGDGSVRLWRDSEQLLDGCDADSGHSLGYTEKKRIGTSAGLRSCPRPCPIRAIFVLGEDPHADLAIRPLPAARTLLELVHYSFLLDVGDVLRHSLQMSAAAALAGSCPVAVLDYPREYGLLKEVRQAVLDHLLKLTESPSHKAIR